jgi:fatty acid/phospholipid biosynthesis enzyme
MRKESVFHETNSRMGLLNGGEEEKKKGKERRKETKLREPDLIFYITQHSIYNSI